MWINRNKAEARATVSGSAGDVVERSRRHGAMFAYGAGVGVDAFAFIKGDHQKHRYS
jgi:hypothetical protein